MSRSMRLLGLVGALALVVSACGGDEEPDADGSPSPTALPVISIGECQTVPDFASEPAEPTGANFNSQLKTAGVLTIGSDLTFPPFESIDEATEDEVGFDVDLAEEIAERLQLEPRWVGTDFGALFTTTLPQGQFDIGISAITVKPERQETIDFTIPYFKADLSLTAVAGSDVKTVDDLRGKVIGAEKDTTGADCAQVVKDQVGATEVKFFDDAPQAFDDLLAGRVAGVINDLPATQAIVAQRSGLEIVQRIETQEVYAIAIGEQKPDLREAVNEKLREIFEDGTFDTIFRKWFGDDPAFDLPPVELKG